MCGLVCVKCNVKWVTCNYTTINECMLFHTYIGKHTCRDKTFLIRAPKHQLLAIVEGYFITPKPNGRYFFLINVQWKGHDLFGWLLLGF